MFITRRGDAMPWGNLRHWQPLKIDALGLVTLLGADDMNKNIGTLQRRCFTECLPFLAAFVVAGDYFTDEQAGYCLYNVSDGIQTTELKGWFTRWLSAQTIRNGTTVFQWQIEPFPRIGRQSTWFASALSFVVVAPLLVCTILMGDWYGVGNSFAVIISIVVRKVLLWQLRAALDAAIMADDIEQSTQSPDPLPGQSKQRTSSHQQEDNVKLFVTRADGKMVTMYAPRRVLSTFYTDCEPSAQRLYHFTRWIGWMAFGAHITVLGMCSLLTQMYTVALLVLSSWASCHDRIVGTERCSGKRQDGTVCEVISQSFTPHLIVEQWNPPSKTEDGQKLDKRMFAYIQAELSQQQEHMLRHWSMLPLDGVPWYDNYHSAKRIFLDKIAVIRGETENKIANMASSEDSFEGNQHVPVEQGTDAGPNAESC